MINVSQDYLDNIYFDTTRTKCKAKLELSDINLSDVTYSIAGGQSWCTSDNVKTDSNPRQDYSIRFKSMEARRNSNSTSSFF